MLLVCDYRSADAFADRLDLGVVVAITIDHADCASANDDPR
jgi:hypothetical protein